MERTRAGAEPRQQPPRHRTRAKPKLFMQSCCTQLAAYRQNASTAALKRLPGKERRAGTLLAGQLIASSVTAGERTRADAEP
jgi:hypothetical protein